MYYLKYSLYNIRLINLIRIYLHPHSGQVKQRGESHNYLSFAYLSLQYKKVCHSGAITLCLFFIYVHCDDVESS